MKMLDSLALNVLSLRIRLPGQENSYPALSLERRGMGHRAAAWTADRILLLLSIRSFGRTRCGRDRIYRGSKIPD